MNILAMQSNVNGNIGIVKRALRKIIVTGSKPSKNIGFRILQVSITFVSICRCHLLLCKVLFLILE